MSFNKNFFENLSLLIKKYREEFPVQSVTVSLKVFGKEYSMFSVITADEALVTFSYYDDKKSSPLPAKSPFPTAWPALTVPYEAIESVEFNPGKPSGLEKGMGFKCD